MVLDGESLVIGRGQPFAAVVVEVDVGGGYAGWQGGRIHGEAMIVAGNLYSAAFGNLHRLVAAAVAKFELVGLRAQRQTQNLMSQADAKNGFLA